MKPLKGSIPRPCADCRTADAKACTRDMRALVERLGALPDSARPTLQSWGVVVLELTRQTRELDRCLKRRRMRQARQIRRHMTVLRTQLLTLEARLEDLAASMPREWGLPR